MRGIWKTDMPSEFRSTQPTGLKVFAKYPVRLGGKHPSKNTAPTGSGVETVIFSKIGTCGAVTDADRIWASTPQKPNLPGLENRDGFLSGNLHNF